MSFSELIRLTKSAQTLRAEIAAMSDADQKSQRYTALLDELSAVNESLSVCAQSTFASAKDGDDLYLVSGRVHGDTEDCAGVYFAADGTEATRLFKVTQLDLDEDDLNEDDESENEDDENGRVYIENCTPIFDTL